MTCCKTKDKKRMCRIMCAHLIGGVAILAAVTALVMWLWNLLIPAIMADIATKRVTPKNSPPKKPNNGSDRR